MDKYLNTYREMISLRGLTDHTLKSYSTYIRAYLDYLSNILQKQPEDVSWDELRDYIRWLQKSRGLPTAPSTMRFHSFVSFPCMCYIILGMTHNFTCVSLMNTFLMFLPEKRHGSLFPLCLI